MESNFTVKELSKDNINEILDLEKSSAPQKLFYYRYDKPGLLEIFNNPKTCKAFGAFDGSKLIGWASYRSDNDRYKDGIFEMSSLMVHKDYRRKNIGLLLFNTRLKELLSRTDVKHIYATCYPKNTPIIMLYLSNNFYIHDFKKDVYGPGADRLYLRYKDLEETV
jgi:ribosomal protein S18 acetylase RimI-like enzyme